MQSSRLKYFMTLLISLSILSSIYLSDYNHRNNQNITAFDSISIETENIFINEEKNNDKNIWIKFILKNIIEVVII